MKLIIDIPEKMYRNIVNNRFGNSNIDRIIKNGLLLSEWLSSFNTESAPKCFEAVQQLKMEVENAKEKNT